MTTCISKSSGRRAVLIIACLLVLPSSASAAIRYVKHNAAGANDGTSWANAYASLQTALTAAGSGDELWVAAGTYKPDGGSGDRTASFRMKVGVGIYGGFFGTETDRSQRSPEDAPTILSGEINNQGLLTDNSYHVVLAINLSLSAVLDGFTITSGYAVEGAPPIPGIPSPDGIFAAGIVFFYGNATFRNLTIENCRSGRGGGMQIHQAQSPTFHNVLFQNNRALDGGGLATDQSGTITMNNCRFIGNVAESFAGGGAGFYFGSHAVLTDCVFENNTAAGEGGGFLVDQNTLQITRVVFRGNSADVGGGACLIRVPQASFTECSFSGNSADTGGALLVTDSVNTTVDRCSFVRNNVTGSGGAVRIAASSLKIRNSTVFGNTAAVSGGGIASSNNATIAVENCALVGNRADSAGAILAQAGDFSTTNSTITNNTALTNTGGLFFSSGATATMANSIVWRNSGPGGDISGLQQINADAPVSLPTADYSIISGTTGPTIHDVDPQFFLPPNPGTDGTWGTPDDQYGDLRLQCPSPASDAGTNAALTPEMTTDLGGAARRTENPNVPNMGVGVIPIVDIGAYEYQPAGPCGTCLHPGGFCGSYGADDCDAVFGRNADGTLTCSDPMVYLDWTVGPGGNGSIQTPFQTLLQAEAGAPSGAIVRIKRDGNYSATNLVLDKPLKLINQSFDGPATLGAP